MSRYHFQVRTETHVLVSDAVELNGADEARVEAARRIGELLTAHAGRLWADEDWRMDVTNEAGLILFIIQVSAMNAASSPPKPHT